MATDQHIETADQTAAAAARPAWRRLPPLWMLAALVIVVDVLAFIFTPPFDPTVTDGSCAFPVCFINGNLEFPPPATIIGTPMPVAPLSLGFAIGISNTIITMWIVMAIVLVGAIVATRGMKERPGGAQNFVEWAYESLYNFATGIGGSEAARFVPIYASFFILILACNWSGLIPPVGKVEFLRAPTSDVNVTLGLALCAFGYFEYQGFRKLGIGYLSKFFPFYEFRNGVGAGIIAVFVGLIELLLEFVKPVTLTMRLFGNIYGGEVALGVITGLTVAIVPLAILGLELMLNFVQALIFSTLMIMFTVLAVESHHEEGAAGHDAADAIEHTGAAGHPATA